MELITNNKTIHKYNLNKLIKISVVDFVEDTWYKYYKEVKWFGFTVQREGFSTYTSFYKISELILKLDNRIIKGNKVYLKPKCVLYFQDDKTVNLYFDTYKEAIEKQRELTNSANWIKFID